MGFTRHSEAEFARAKQRLAREGLLNRFDFIVRKLAYKNVVHDICRNSDDYLYYCDLDIMLPKGKAIALLKELLVTNDELHMMFIINLYANQHKEGHLFDGFVKK